MTEHDEALVERVQGQMMPESADERHMFNDAVKVIGEGNVLLQVAETLRIWSLMSPAGSYKEMLAIMSNECRRAALDAAGLREAQREIEARQRHLEHASRVVSDLTGERDALRQRNKELVEALEYVRDEAMLGAHSAHWDRTGGHGAGCPACHANARARETINTALARAKGENK